MSSKSWFSDSPHCTCEMVSTRLQSKSFGLTTKTMKNESLANVPLWKQANAIGQIPHQQRSCTCAEKQKLHSFYKAFIWQGQVT